MSLWRKRKNCDNIAPNIVAKVHHNEQKHDNLVNILNNLSIKSKDLSMQSKKIDDDDDIQDYKRTWVGLTQDELNMIGDSMRTWNSWTITDVYFAIEAKLKEKNT